MGNRRAVITQPELTRILKAYRDAGLPVVRTEIARDGTVTVYSQDRATDEANNPWDAA